MRVGIHYVRFDGPGGETIGPTLLATAEAAEAGGLSAFTLMDHYFQMDWMTSASDPMLEGYTALGFLAGRTETLTLGLLVTGVMYRHPGLLAKIVTTLDVLSGGRAQLGIGAAWYQREHAALGVPFPPLAERFERLEETLQICVQMCSDDDGPYEGRHYQLAETLCSPRPIRQPHPPILIGGGGERKTLALVARYADKSNLFGESVGQVGDKLEALRRHCETEHRGYESIEKTILATGSNPFTDTKAWLDEMADYGRLGVSMVELMPRGDPVAYTERVGAELVPRLAEL